MDSEVVARGRTTASKTKARDNQGPLLFAASVESDQ